MNKTLIFHIHIWYYNTNIVSIKNKNSINKSAFAAINLMNNNFKNREYSQIQADNVNTIYLKDIQKTFELKMQFLQILIKTFIIISAIAA